MGYNLVMEEDKLKRIFAQLSAIKVNLPEGYDINEKYIDTYNKLVDELASGMDESLNEFLVPNNELRHRITSGNYLTGETNYSEDRWCERGMFLMKLDSLMGYFTLTLQPVPQTPEHQLGFRVRHNKET